MALSIPSLDSLAKAVRAAFRAEADGVDAEVWPNNATIAAKVFGQGVFGAFLRLRWLYDQIFASTATGRHLDRHAYEVGLARKSAKWAAGYVTCQGLAGETVPAGRRFIRESDGRVFVTTAAVEIPSSGSVLLTVQAEAPGYLYNAVAGAVLAREGAYDELTSDATVATGGLADGANAESDDDLRERVLDVKRNPPMGGAVHDYRRWAWSVTGVRKVFASRYDDDGSRIAVVVLGQGRGTTALPSPTLIAAVQDVIDEERPLAAKVTVTAPVAKVINVTIAALDPASTAVRDEIARELDDLFYERATVVLPDDLPSFPRAWLESAIDNAAGEVRHTLVAPAGDVALSVGDYPILGTVTISS